MLHGATFLATNLAIPVQAGIFFNQRVSIGSSTQMLRDKLQEGRYTVQWLENAMH